MGPRRPKRSSPDDRALAFDAEEFESSLVWILGAPRTGSTWLLSMLADHPRVVPVNETQIGLHLAPFAPRVAPAAGQGPPQVTLDDLFAIHPDYILAPRFEHVWAPPLKQMILARLEAQVEEQGDAPAEGWVIAVKEPAGGESTDRLFRLLPRSRLLFLLRDGRDVLDSELAARHRGTWLSDLGGGYELPTEQRLEWIRQWAWLWLLRTETVQRVYGELPAEQRLLVRYEDLLSDTAGRLRTIHAWLGLAAGDDELQATATRHGFDAIPAEEKGSMKFARAATPGLWRQNLSAEEQTLVNELLGEKLRELGYDA